MLLNELFHIAFKTPDLEATRRFYTEILGMELAARPKLDFPGIWIKCPTPGGDAIFHVYAGHAAKNADGSYPSGTGAIDHVAVTAHGFYEIRDKLKAAGLPWRENLIPGLPLWQIFVYDPSGIQLELTFNAAAEAGPKPKIPAKRQYRAGETWFAPDAYAQFSKPAKKRIRKAA